MLLLVEYLTAPLCCELIKRSCFLRGNYFHEIVIPDRNASADDAEPGNRSKRDSDDLEYPLQQSGRWT